MSDEPRASRSGYGNIYTPHAGSMIITVQRESGLANRTITLTQRQVRLLRIGLYTMATLLIIVGGSWLFLATQAARVPVLTRRITTLQEDVKRVDTLQRALSDMEHRFQQVQHMLGITDAPTSAPTSTPASAPTSAEPSKPPRRERNAGSSPAKVAERQVPAPAATPPSPPDTTSPTQQSDSTSRAPF